MDDKYIFNYLKNYVDSKYTIDVKNCDDNFLSITKEFITKIRTDFTNDEDFGKLLMCVYIPSLYKVNWSKEKLFTKLVEVLFAEWARRMGYDYEIITQKSGIEDIRITINSKTIVVDSKTFRLGRSQGAPNVKDFLKLESVKHWIENCKKNGLDAIGGLIVYTSLHEWKKESEVYIQCSTKSTPTIMLPYKYLAYLLDNKSKYDTKKLLELWNFNELFPKPLPKSNNKKLYWEKINPKICEITNTSLENLSCYMNNYANPFILKCVNHEKEFLNNEIDNIIKNTEETINNMDTNILKKEYAKYMTKVKTEPIKKILKYINQHRKE